MDKWTLFVCVGIPITFVARYLRKIAIYLERKEGAE